MSGIEEVSTPRQLMSMALQGAVDDLTGRERELAIMALVEAADGGTLAPLHRALAVELRLAALREQEAVRSLEGAYLAASGAVADDGSDAPPPATGRAVAFDPGTGQFTLLRLATDAGGDTASTLP